MDTTPLGEVYSYRSLEFEQPLSFQDELTLYDDMPAEQKPNIVELQKQLNLPLTSINTPATTMPNKEASSTMTSVPTATVTHHHHDSEMDEARKEVDNVCMQLGISAGEFNLIYIYALYFSI